ALLLVLLPIAKVARATEPMRPTVTTSSAIIISISDIPASLPADLRTCRITNPLPRPDLRIASGHSVPSSSVPHPYLASSRARNRHGGPIAVTVCDVEHNSVGGHVCTTGRLSRETARAEIEYGARRLGGKTRIQSGRSTRTRCVHDAV